MLLYSIGTNHKRAPLLFDLFTDILFSARFNDQFIASVFRILQFLHLDCGGVTEFVDTLYVALHEVITCSASPSGRAEVSQSRDLEEEDMFAQQPS